MPDTAARIAIDKQGHELLRDPLLNKGTAFTTRERDEFHLHGLLPHEVNDIETQAQRAYAMLSDLSTPEAQYLGLVDLLDRNEHLFYKVLMDHIEEFMPVVYTPTVGWATQSFSRVFRRGRGVWITPACRGRMREVLETAIAGRDIRLMVVTDGESILGIGDQGAGGMAISVGKLALYVAGAGIPPHATLPVTLDVGTNSELLANDPLYLGWREPRLRGADYDALVAEFVEAANEVMPNALLQWEDFRKDTALDLLDRHHGDILSFNDDIQGTGAVALAGVLSALRVTGEPLADQRVLIHGAGAAGLGIARQIKAELRRSGLRDEDIQQRVGVLDSSGLLVDDRQLRDAYKAELAWPAEFARSLGISSDACDLETTAEQYRPTVLIGTSGQPGAFGEGLVRHMAAHTQQPVIMPFSNPTDHSEAIPEELVRWTDGRALIATGSPFAPVPHGNRKIQIGQGNNVLIFPGLGLGALAAGARSVSDTMVSAAAAALAEQVLEEELAVGALYPSMTRLREVSRAVAVAVGQQAIADGEATANQVEASVDRLMWRPEYPEYEKAR